MQTLKQILVFIIILASTNAFPTATRKTERIIQIPTDENSKFNISYHVDEDLMIYENTLFCYLLKLNISEPRVEKSSQNNDDSSLVYEELKSLHVSPKYYPMKDSEVKVSTNSICLGKSVMVLSPRQDYHAEMTPTTGKQRLKRQLNYNQFQHYNSYQPSYPQFHQNTFPLKYENGHVRTIQNGYRMPSFAQPPIQDPGHFQYYNSYDYNENPSQKQNYHYFAQPPQEKVLPVESYAYQNSEYAQIPQISKVPDDMEGSESLFPETIVKDGTVFYRHDEADSDTPPSDSRSANEDSIRGIFATENQALSSKDGPIKGPDIHRSPFQSGNSQKHEHFTTSSHFEHKDQTGTPVTGHESHLLNQYLHENQDMNRVSLDYEIDKGKPGHLHDHDDSHLLASPGISRIHTDKSFQLEKIDIMRDKEIPAQESNLSNKLSYDNQLRGPFLDHNYSQELVIGGDHKTTSLDARTKDTTHQNPFMSNSQKHNLNTFKPVSQEARNDPFGTKVMFDSILEQVHQPDYVDPVISTIDDGGLTGGSGDAHLEAEIEQVYTGPLLEGGEIPDIDQKEDATGIVTYAHIDAGKPPGPGELLKHERKFSSIEAEENFNNSEVYDYPYKYDDQSLENYNDVTDDQVSFESSLNQKEFFPRYEFKNMISDDMSKFMSEKDRFIPEFSVVDTTEPTLSTSQENSTDNPTTAPSLTRVVMPGHRGSIREIASLRPDQPTIQVITLGKNGSKGYAPGRGVSLKSGQSIPGAEAYKIPPGFRARIFYGVPPPGIAGLTIKGNGFALSKSNLKDISSFKIDEIGTSNKLSFMGSNTLEVSSHPKRLVGAIPKHESMTPKRKSSSVHEGNDCGYYTEDCQQVKVPFETKICQPLFISAACCC